MCETSVKFIKQGNDRLVAKAFTIIDIDELINTTPQHIMLIFDSA